MVDKFTLGMKIRQLRENKNLTQLQLAEMIEKSSNEISNIETGKTNPHLNTLMSISKSLGVSLDYLVSKEKSIDKQGCIHEVNEKIANMSNFEIQHILEYIEFYQESEKRRIKK